MDGQSRLKRSGERPGFEATDQEGKGGEQKQEKKTEGLHPRLEVLSFNAQPRPQSMALEMAFCWHYNERSMVAGETGDLFDPPRHCSRPH